MSYSLNDLSPNKPKIILGDKELFLSLITLRISEKIETEIAPLKNIYEMINKNGLIILDIIWLLLLDKEKFNSKKDFIDFIYKNTKTSEVGAVLYNAFYDAHIKSMPKIKNKARYDELLKISQAQETTKPCYGVYYDKIAKRYGYSIDQFCDLTLAQLHILLTVSSDQNYEEIEVQAALQGRKLKPRMKMPDVEEKDDKQLDDDAKEMLARLKAAHGKR